MKKQAPSNIIFYTLPHSPSSLQIQFANETEGKTFASCHFRDKTLIIKLADNDKTLTITEFNKRHEFYKKMNEVASLFELVKQREYSSPSQWGLIPRKLSKPILSSQFRNLQDKNAFCKELLQASSRELWSGMYGWFHPDSDPEKFGTLFLVPILLAGKNHWALMQMGVEEVIERTVWDNTYELKKISEKCCEDPDLLLTMKALEDSESMKKKNEEYEYKKRILEARKVFEPKKNQIRPRLTEKCIIESSEEVFNKRHMVTISSHDLRPYPVFGYKTIKEERAQPIWIAACVYFKAIPSEDVYKIDDMYQTLQQKLSDKNLGTVLKYVEQENKLYSKIGHAFGARSLVQEFFTPKLWIAKEPDLFLEYASILVDEDGVFLPENDTYKIFFTNPHRFN